MKSITIHGIDEETEKLINQRAKSAGTSVNKVVKELLAKALGLDKDRIDHREEFLDLFGVWTEEDEKQFLEAVQDLETIHSGDWK
jgi:valyl-tRNA synthetase